MRGVTTDGAQGHANTPISTHTPHARRDGGFPYLDTLVASFQLTRLMRGVTYLQRDYNAITGISTHTPHARRDSDDPHRRGAEQDFNSHASCEA